MEVVSETQKCSNCDEVMSYSITTYFRTGELHWTCDECGWTYREFDKEGEIKTTKNMIGEFRAAHHKMYQGNEKLLDQSDAVLDEFNTWLDYILRKET